MQNFNKIRSLTDDWHKTYLEIYKIFPGGSRRGSFTKMFAQGVGDLTLFNPGFFGFLWPGWISPPPENNVTVELAQWNLAQVCICQRTTSMPNLVAIAQLVTSLWRHQYFLDSIIEDFVNQVLFRYENVATIFIWLFGMLECCSLHLNRKIKKLSTSGPQKPLKSSKFWIFSEMLTSAKIVVKFQCFHKK